MKTGQGRDNSGNLKHESVLIPRTASGASLSCTFPASLSQCRRWEAGFENSRVPNLVRVMNEEEIRYRWDEFDDRCNFVERQSSHSYSGITNRDLQYTRLGSLVVGYTESSGTESDKNNEICSEIPSHTMKGDQLVYPDKVF